jgi:hypothetical protein
MDLGPRISSVHLHIAGACVLATMIALLSACGADGAPDSRAYVRSYVHRCLIAKGVIAASIDPAELRPHVRQVRGVTGVITWVPGPVKGLPHPGPTIDGGALVFTRTAGEAASGSDALAESFIYHKYEGEVIRALHPSPPTKVAAKTLESVSRNVVLFWQYPRRHRLSSSRLIQSCLSRGHS